MARAAPPEVAMGRGVLARCSPSCLTQHWEVLGSSGKDGTGEDGGGRAQTAFKVGLVSGYSGDFLFVSVYIHAETINTVETDVSPSFAS